MTRVLRAAASAGIAIRSFEVTADGAIKVAIEADADQHVDIFEQWEDKL